MMSTDVARAWLTMGRLTVCLSAAAIVVGCNLFFPGETYQPTRIPADVTRLFEVHGNTDSDTVWIYEQGGPTHDLLDDPLGHFDNFPNREDIHLVHVHQTLTLDNDLASRYEELSLADLKAEVDVSVEILHRTIRHFRAGGKRVVVVGHSFGALLVTRYLALKGPGNAHRFLIMAGRLDLPTIVVEGVLNGTWYYFPDGGDPVPHPEIQPEDDVDFIELRLLGAAGHDRYTNLLADTDLERVIYAYGTADEQVGSLSATEDAFLRSRGATVIKVTGGGHVVMFEDADVARMVVDALQ